MEDGDQRDDRSVAWGLGFRGNYQQLNGMWGSGPDDVWAVGNAVEEDESASSVYRWNGSQCSQVAGGPRGTSTSGLKGPLPSARWDGAAWSVANTSEDLNDVWSMGGDVWAVGNGGLIVRVERTGSGTIDFCAGVVCNTPPGGSCNASGVLTTFASTGTCSQGACSYTSTATPCKFGCNGATLSCYPDQDNDGYGACSGGCPNGANSDKCCGDCNDSNPNVFPGRVEIAQDSIDQDCDGVDRGNCPDNILVGDWEFRLWNSCLERRSGRNPSKVDRLREGIDGSWRG